MLIYQCRQETNKEEEDKVSRFNRNDIMIAVSDYGVLYVAQGGPACRELYAHSPDLDDSESMIFHSQLPYRCAWYDGERFRVGTHRDAKSAGAKSVVEFGDLRQCKATGGYIIVGAVDMEKK